jgi:hypothetical protein
MMACIWDLFPRTGLSILKELSAPVKSDTAYQLAARKRERVHRFNYVRTTILYIREGNPDIAAP